MSARRQIETLRRIDMQQAVVDALTPGTPEHRIALRVLSLLKDCFHLMKAVDALKVEAKRRELSD